MVKDLFTVTGEVLVRALVGLTACFVDMYSKG